jgi:hypothetical protein
MIRKYWNNWSDQDGGWTVPIVFGDNPPIRFAVSGDYFLADDNRQRFAVRTYAYVIEEDHPLCPAHTSDDGFLGYGEPILEGVYETNFYDQWDTSKRDILRRAKQGIRDLIDDPPKWLTDWVASDIADALA